MKCLIALGSNLGDRWKNLEYAAKSLDARKTSPVFENPALLPEGAPADWNRPFVNAVMEVEWSATAEDLLAKMQMIENELGRDRRQRWSPRALDLDLLSFGDRCLDTPDLKVPHPSMNERAFVLAPLKHLYPSRALQASHKLKE